MGFSLRVILVQRRPASVCCWQNNTFTWRVGCVRGVRGEGPHCHCSFMASACLAILVGWPCSDAEHAIKTTIQTGWSSWSLLPSCFLSRRIWFLKGQRGFTEQQHQNRHPPPHGSPSSCSPLECVDHLLIKKACKLHQRPSKSTCIMHPVNMEYVSFSGLLWCERVQCRNWWSAYCCHLFMVAVCVKMTDSASLQQPESVNTLAPCLLLYAAQTLLNKKKQKNKKKNSNSSQIAHLDCSLLR